MKIQNQMPDPFNRTINIKERYWIKGNAFWAGFFSFFGADSFYTNAIKKIRETSVVEALQGDVNALCQDSHRVLHSPGIHDITKELVDTSESRLENYYKKTNHPVP